MYRLRSLLFSMLSVGVGFALGAWMLATDEQVRAFGESVEGLIVPTSAFAQSNERTMSPVKALTEHDVYYPGTEDLAPDEMRVTACGTGMPNARPKQAAACFLVELGNGDKFIFDIGSWLHSSVSRR